MGSSKWNFGLKRLEFLKFERSCVEDRKMAVPSSLKDGGHAKGGSQYGASI